METSSDAEEFPAISPYGWNSSRAQWWDSNSADIGGGVAVRPGRVTRVDRGECDVVTPLGAERVVSDSQRAQSKVAPATGDWVAVVDDDELGPAITAVLPRRTSMVRRDPGPVVTDQVLVANVDVVAIVHGLDQPFNAARLERFLVLAYDSGADPLVILTKADLPGADPALVVAEVAALTDADVLVTSVPHGLGIDDLRRHVTGRTVVFFGLSGTGKSTLTNALLGHEVQATTEVRETDSRGRHTTTRRELFIVPGGGVLIDTPGVRAVGLWDAWLAMNQVYTEIAHAAERCRFSDCTHRTEPGCAVRDGVTNGDIDQGRVDRYHELLIELTELDDEIVESDRRKRRGGRSNK